MDIYRHNGRDKQFLIRMLAMGLGSAYILYRLTGIYNKKGLPDNTFALILLGALALLAIMLAQLSICELKSYLQKKEFYLSIDGNMLSTRSLAFQGPKEVDLSSIRSYEIEGSLKKQFVKFHYSSGRKDSIHILLAKDDPRMNRLKEHLDLIIEKAKTPH